jgi:zinc transport system ATP-binding protein
MSISPPIRANSVDGAWPDMSDTAVHIENLSVYYGHTRALSDVCLDVAVGEFLGIIGPNGGGKTTLLRAMLGLVSYCGRVEIFGGPPQKNRPQLGYVPQFAAVDRQFPITVFEVVLTGRLDPGLRPFYRYSKKDKQIAEELLGRVGLADIVGRRISELSGGQFQKMLIARALAREPRLLLLDEPTASVDAVSRQQIFDLLAELNRDMTIILVTHDLFAISSQIKRLACLSGRLVYHGEPELTDSIVQNLYGCPVDLIAHGVPHRVLREHGEESDKDDSSHI